MPAKAATPNNVPDRVREAAQRARAAVTSSGPGAVIDPTVPPTPKPPRAPGAWRETFREKRKRQGPPGGILLELERAIAEGLPVAKLAELLRLAGRLHNQRGARTVVRGILLKACPQLAPRIPSMCAADLVTTMEAIGQHAAHRKSIELRRAMALPLLGRTLELADEMHVDEIGKVCRSLTGAWLDEPGRAHAARLLVCVLPRMTASVSTLRPATFCSIAYATSFLPLDDEGKARAHEFIGVLMPHAIACARELDVIKLSCTLAPFEILEIAPTVRGQAASLVRFTLARLTARHTLDILSLIRRSAHLPLDDETWRIVARFTGRSWRVVRGHLPGLGTTSVELLWETVDAFPLPRERREMVRALIDRELNLRLR